MRRNDRFLWVKFQLDAICTEISDKGIEKALEKVPDDMDVTYERILGTINHKPRAQRELARKILIWVAYARQPLPIDSLAYAISIEMGTKSLEDLNSAIPTEESILDVCANLISVDSSGNRYVRFVHFSVQEFLKSNRSTTLNVEYEVSQREIAQTCMIFLTLFPKRSEDKLQLHRYTFNQWPHHLLAGNLNSLRVDDHIVTLASSFFETGPLLFTNVWSISSLFSIAYLKFSPSALALTFDLPGTYGRLSENKQSMTIYHKQDFPVLADDNLAIHYAIGELDSVPVVQRLYRHGYSLKYSYFNSYTKGTTIPNWLQLSPLYSAQNIQMARYLLDNGTRIQPQYLRGRYFDPLTYFVCQTNWGSEVIRRLLDGVVDQDDRRLENTLHISEDESRIDVNAQGGEYGNALQAAAYDGNLEVVQLLLDKGAEVNAQGGHYGNALQAAAYDGKSEVVRLLLDKGAEVKAQGGHYGNALQATACGSNTKVVQLLLDQGVDINTQGGVFGTALQAAATYGHIEVIQLLLDNGANVNIQGGIFGTVLQAAAHSGNIECIQLLLDKGANFNTRGEKYGVALKKMLALEPVGTGQMVPGGLPLLVELVQDYVPTLMEHSVITYQDVVIKMFPYKWWSENNIRCSLDVLREILESRGWKREAQDSEGESDRLEAEQEPDENENENDDRNTATIEDEVEDGGGAGAENETSQELQKSLLEARLDSSPKATARVWKLLGFTFLVYLLYTFSQLLWV